MTARARLIPSLPALAGFLLLAPLLSAAAATPPNELTPAEKKAGWRLLFDGRTTSGWRGFKKADFPKDRWVVKEGALAHVKSAGADDHGGADIVTTDTFSEFDLRFDWRISPAGNSGLKYFVTEEREGPIAHEYQVLDDAGHPDGKVGPHRQTAAFYDVLAPAAGKPTRPIGEWNESRVLVRGTHVEHWLNGSRVLEYELGSPEVKAAIAKSKFKDVAGFGTRIDGHILLQDHGDEVAFRNLKILSLRPTP
jgi:hypothetical protein